ncbi:MAG: hypothetical protein M1836_001460 [Candelina mexicana]|nr:MAG: hypothetical protein M1836_001460 [Candelina mexicana]
MRPSSLCRGRNLGASSTSGLARQYLIDFVVELVFLLKGQRGHVVLVARMLNRTLKRSILDTRLPLSVLPPTFLLPFRARLFNTSNPFIDETTPANTPPPTTTTGSKPHDFDAFSSGTSSTYGPLRNTRPSAQAQAKNTDSEAITSNYDLELSERTIGQPPHLSSPTTSMASTTTTHTAGPLSESVKDLLPLLRAQTPHYITIHIHGRPYLLTAGDVLRLPFLMPSVIPGDILRLNRATHLGSREYTLKGSPYVNERLFVCRARVIGVEAEPMRIKEKTKRRQRHVKTVRSKHKFTILRVTELRVKSVEAIEEEGDREVLTDKQESGNDEA